MTCFIHCKIAFTSVQFADEHPKQLRGSLAQLVEQRPEEPCVPSSSLGGATTKTDQHLLVFFIGNADQTKN